MFLKYTSQLFKNLNKYDKKATNPFLKTNKSADFSASIYEKTYIWVEENKDQLKN